MLQALGQLTSLFKDRHGLHSIIALLRSDSYLKNEVHEEVLRESRVIAGRVQFSFGDLQTLGDKACVEGKTERSVTIATREHMPNADQHIAIDPYISRKNKGNTRVAGTEGLGELCRFLSTGTGLLAVKRSVNKLTMVPNLQIWSECHVAFVLETWDTIQLCSLEPQTSAQWGKALLALLKVGQIAPLRWYYRLYIIDANAVANPVQRINGTRVHATEGQEATQEYRGSRVTRKAMHNDDITTVRLEPVLRRDAEFHHEFQGRRGEPTEVDINNLALKLGD
mmetsp:Transcript_34466/g.68031  ORF Transcript_34466/g.68031 Transcript_34466/m.68031 type:complete len:281 (+) Transcript_34466:717-1559(+)